MQDLMMPSSGQEQLLPLQASLHCKSSGHAGQPSKDGNEQAVCAQPTTLDSCWITPSKPSCFVPTLSSTLTVSAETKPST